MMRITLALAMMTVAIAACGRTQAAEDELVEPLVPGASTSAETAKTPEDIHGVLPVGVYRLEAASTCPAVAPSFTAHTAFIARSAGGGRPMAALPVPWPATDGHETFDLTKPHASYAADGVAASCATGWVERSADLELIDTTTLRVTFREYEIGCGAEAPACMTKALFELERRSE